MESIYRRYHNSIRPYKLIVLFLLLAHTGISQSSGDIEDKVNLFFSEEFISLLQRVQDYNTVGENDVNLRSSVSQEIQNLSISINSNAVIEYDLADQSGNPVVISDQILPYLINYSARDNNAPSITIECILERENDIHAYFYSTHVLSNNGLLSRAIIRKVNDDLELRRISYFNSIPNECNPKAEIAETDHIVIPGATDIASHQAYLRDRNQIPRITIREATAVNGQAIIYGFIQNNQSNGILTDLETGLDVKVSPLDGFFVLNKLLTTDGYRELRLKYQYGEKFITDRKLVFVKS